MKILKTFVILLFTSTVIISCKKEVKTIETTKKEFVAAVKPQIATFTITGMTCPEGCAKTIEKKLAGMNGVQSATVDFDKKQATVNFDLDKLSATDLVKAVETTGDGKSYKVSNLKTGV